MVRMQLIHNAQFLRTINCALHHWSEKQMNTEFFMQAAPDTGRRFATGPSQLTPCVVKNKQDLS